jgi:hypothetical protein
MGRKREREPSLAEISLVNLTCLGNAVAFSVLISAFRLLFSRSFFAVLRPEVGCSGTFVRVREHRRFASRGKLPEVKTAFVEQKEKSRM